MSKRSASAEGAALPATPAVHTSALPTPQHPPDAYTGLGGTYQRDPVTGLRTPVAPAGHPADTDTAAL